MLSSFVSNISNCFTLDISVSDKEEIALVRSNKPIVSIDKKMNDCKNCRKYLIKYDGINSLISLLENLSAKKDNLKVISKVITGLSAFELYFFLF